MDEKERGVLTDIEGKSASEIEGLIYAALMRHIAEEKHINVSQWVPIWLTVLTIMLSLVGVYTATMTRVAVLENNVTTIMKSVEEIKLEVRKNGK